MFSDNQSGFILSVALLAILTLCGVSMAKLVGKRHADSRVKNEMLDDYAAGRSGLEDLRAELDAVTEAHREAYSESSRNTAAIGSSEQLAIRISESNSELASRREELKVSLKRLREDFDMYRKRYRTQARNDAVGEEMGSLLLRSGRRFESVRITRVTAAGIEISHADGLARITRDELGADYTERFQWSHDERTEAPTPAPVPKSR